MVREVPQRRLLLCLQQSGGAATHPCSWRSVGKVKVQGRPFRLPPEWPTDRLISNEHARMNQGVMLDIRAVGANAGEGCNSGKCSKLYMLGTTCMLEVWVPSNTNPTYAVDPRGRKAEGIDTVQTAENNTTAAALHLF